MNFNKAFNTVELYKLLDDLNINNAVVIRKSKLKDYIYNNKDYNIIINLDDLNNGTHWVACNTSKKIYFDSYNQPTIKILEKNGYKQLTNNMEIQRLTDKDCGPLSALFLYYLKKNRTGDFYKMFNDLY